MSSAKEFKKNLSWLYVLVILVFVLFACFGNDVYTRLSQLENNQLMFLERIGYKEVCVDEEKWNATLFNMSMIPSAKTAEPSGMYLLTCFTPDENYTTESSQGYCTVTVFRNGVEIGTFDTQKIIKEYSRCKSWELRRLVVK